MSTDKPPEGWTRLKFGDVVRKVNDRVDPETSGIERYVAGEHMNTDDLTIRRWGQVGDGYLGPAFHMRFRPGQVLYGSRRTYLRKVAVADFEGICANTTFVLEPSAKDLLPEFLPLVMTTEDFHDHSTKQSKGSVNPYINFSDLTWYEFALPPLDEQQRIVELHKAHLAVHEGFSRVEGAAETLFDSVLRSIFSGSAGRAEWRTLADVAEVQLGRMLSAERSTGPDLAPYVKNTNVQWDGLDLDALPMMSFPSSERSRYSLRAGDVLVCEGGDAGRSVLLEEDLDGIYYQKAVHRVRTACLDPRYLHFYLIFAYRTGELKKLSTGTAIPHLPAERFRRLPVPIVSEAIQTEVADKLNRVRQVLAAARKSRDCMVAQTRAVLNAALEGAEDVQ